MTVTAGNDTTAPVNWLAADPAGTANRDAFQALVEQYGATSSAWQVLVVPGGSPFAQSKALSPGEPVTDRYYAWANVKVFLSGKVEIDGCGFSDTYGPTKLLNQVVLAH